MLCRVSTSAVPGFSPQVLPLLSNDFKEPSEWIRPLMKMKAIIPLQELNPNIRVNANGGRQDGA